MGAADRGTPGPRSLAASGTEGHDDWWWCSLGSVGSLGTWRRTPEDGASVATAVLSSCSGGAGLTDREAEAAKGQMEAA